MTSTLLLLAVLCAPASGTCEPPMKLAIDYTLTIDSTDLSSFAVEMRMRNAPARFTVAARAHPEYDDKYWRYLEDMRAENATLTRMDSVRWEATNARGDVTLRYRMKLPATSLPRAAWRAYLTANGGVVGGPHSFLYVIGQENAPATVRLVLPRSWHSVSGMTRDQHGVMSASDIFTVMESPIMVGRMSQWAFAVQNVPHHVSYLPGPNAVQFDSIAFVGAVQKIVQQTVNVFAEM